jgi:hypothetical protein
MILVLPAGASTSQVGKQKSHTFCDTTQALVALYDVAIRGLDVLGGTNNREGNGLREDAHMICASFIIRLNRW